LEYIVVSAELLIALTMTFVAWRFRRSFSLFLFGILLGMTWCEFLHGFFFGVLQIEGPHAANDPGGLIGFGIVASILPGIPVGTALGAVLLFARNRRFCGSSRPLGDKEAVRPSNSST
jgi:hypothetical protein